MMIGSDIIPWDGPSTGVVNGMTRSTVKALGPYRDTGDNLSRLDLTKKDIWVFWNYVNLQIPILELRDQWL